MYDEKKQVLVVGNFGGLASSARSVPITGRRAFRLDVDRFETVLEEFSPEIRFPAAAVTRESILIGIRSLNDFHPDNLVQRVPVLDTLRQARQRMRGNQPDWEGAMQLLRDSGLLDTVASQQTEVERDTRTQKTQERADSEPSETEGIDGTNTWQELLHKPAGMPNHGQVDITPILKQAVEGHVVPTTTSKQQKIRELVETTLCQYMRLLLHDVRFQLLEANWRSLHQIASEVEMDEVVDLHLLDIDKEELTVDLNEDDWRDSAFFRWLESWYCQPSLMVGCYTFGNQESDIRTLKAIGHIAADVRCPFLSGAELTLLGCSSLADTASPRDWADVDDFSLRSWRQLRSSKIANWIGLTLPRILVRLPYGARTDPIQSFDFEEFVAIPEHQHFLWGSSALAVLRLVLQSWVQGVPAGTVSEIGELPCYTFKNAAQEQVMQPVGETLLSDRTVTAMLARGIMPIVSHRNWSVARVVSFQSIADPPSGLKDL